MYIGSQEFLITLFLGIIGLIAFMEGVEELFRRSMNADKKKWFSYNHLNDSHEKWDWTIRIGSLVLYLLVYLLTGFSLFIVVLAPILIVVSTEGVRAYMEKKYASNPNNYKIPLVRIGLILFVSLLFIAYAYQTSMFS
ncbi:DUF4181 domain-containing protein [Halobacillus locisalis]|uniref:DUF4181 domain-containing protein n=1 Tax=Halobacillus locisalis TaxID=220753 RepID=A0A838CSH1_9BACI|nr:DUF4181 domain-containing protein [Halobacillus locisalis]MBA2174769.1 DUF4181 domain-containing protein [Halobacillus locisalis]